MLFSLAIYFKDVLQRTLDCFNNRIEDAVDTLKDEDPDFSEDNLRLMRVKFLSEYAN